MDKIFEQLFIADIYEYLEEGEHLIMKNAILYKTNVENTYRIINLTEYNEGIADRPITYPSNLVNIGCYYAKEMKNFIYMNGKEIEKVMKYTK